MDTEQLSEATIEAAGRQVRGHTIAWGGGKYFDFDNPGSCPMTIEEYAYALAGTVRWRGQTWHNGRRCFFWVAQHCTIGAEELLRAGAGRRLAFEFLMHESDEAPLGDLPGPAKGKLPGWRPLAKECADAINGRFGVTFSNPDLIKRWDIRMLVTEKRDLLRGHDEDTFTIDGVQMADANYKPFDTPIVPVAHPEKAARRFLALYHELRRAA